MASGSNSHDENTPERVWDEEFECERIGDVLYAVPISEYRPPPPPPQPLPPREDGKQQPHVHERPPAANQLGGRKRKGLTTSVDLEERKYYFHLFHCEEMNILAMNEVGTENKTFYVLTPFEKNGKKKIQAKQTRGEQMRAISPVEGELYPNNIGYRTNLSIQQRLEGEWTIELRARVESLKMERFYSHEMVSKTFRSMNEVATFIAYNLIY